MKYENFTVDKRQHQLWIAETWKELEEFLKNRVSPMEISRMYHYRYSLERLRHKENSNYINTLPLDAVNTDNEPRE